MGICMFHLRDTVGESGDFVTVRDVNSFTVSTGLPRTFRRGRRKRHYACAEPRLRSVLSAVASRSVGALSRLIEQTRPVSTSFVAARSTSAARGHLVPLPDISFTQKFSGYGKLATGVVVAWRVFLPRPRTNYLANLAGAKRLRIQRKARNTIFLRNIIFPECPGYSRRIWRNSRLYLHALAQVMIYRVHRVALRAPCEDLFCVDQSKGIIVHG
ncbi:uncharacterized protein [Prorops nasuta]|uniref:uncharacterized protein n=1 Tax=Prorops nasuta TaxID=863751 RepID=UPI0034CD43FB